VGRREPAAYGLGVLEGLGGKASLGGPVVPCGLAGLFGPVGFVGLVGLSELSSKSWRAGGLGDPSEIMEPEGLAV
jgi:hypothetical protein